MEKSLKLLFDPPNLETLGTLKNINPVEMSDGAETKYLLVKGNSKDNVYCNKYYHFMLLCTICPRSSDPFYIVTYYIKWGYYVVHPLYKMDEVFLDVHFLKAEKRESV